MSDGIINNPHYRRMLSPQCYADRIDYLDFMIDFYFKVMLAMRHVKFKSSFRAQMTSSLQMMFTKGKSLRCLVDGYCHNRGSFFYIVKQTTQFFLLLLERPMNSCAHLK